MNTFAEDCRGKSDRKYGTSKSIELS